MASKKPDKHPTPDELGKMLQNIYESGYLDRNQAYKMSFVKGMLSGLGGVLGATIVVALLLWILTLLNYTPLRPVTEKIQNTVQQR